MSKVREAVDRLMAEYHDDHNWAQWARQELELAVHQDDGCPVFRNDCDICVNAVSALRRWEKSGTILKSEN